MPVISVIIPTYNHEKYISEAIQSALDQTYKDLEIIVVDDGSTDKTRELVKTKWPMVKYIYQNNQGISAARNKGIRESTGDHVAFLDADDFWYKDKLALQVKQIEQNDKIGLITCGRKVIGETGEEEYIPEINNLERTDILKKLAISNIIGGGSTVLVRRSCFDKVGYFDEELKVSEDCEMWFRICKEYEYRSITAPLVGYRSIKGSQSYYGDKNLVNQIKYLNKIKKEIDRDTILKAYSEKYYCAAWSFKESGNRLAALKYILKAFIIYPINIIKRRDMIGLFVKIIFGEKVFSIIKKGK